jgi:hypothetical protein
MPNYLEIANNASVKSEKNYLSIAENAPFKPEIAISNLAKIKTKEYSPLDIAGETIKGTARDIVQIPASFLNQLLLNLPRQAAKEYGLKYPEEKGVTSRTARLLSYGAGVAGGFKNPLFRTAGQAVKGARLLPQMVKGAITSAAYGTEDMFKPENIALKAGIGAAIPLAARGGEIITRPLRNIFKTGRDYLYNKVAAPIAQKIQENLKKVPEIGKRLGLKDDTIELLKKYGYDKVANVDTIEQKAIAGFNNAMHQKTTVYGDKIDISSTLKKMENKFNAIKKVDPHNKLGGIIDNLKKLQPAKGGFYKEILPTTTQLKRQLARGEKLTDIATEVRVSRTELTNLRDQLNNLYRDRGFDREVFEIIDSLYDDAEKAGLKGIQRARELFKQFKQFSKVQKDLLKIEKIDATKLHSDLLTVASNPKKYQSMIDKYSPYLGDEEAKSVFTEALKVRSGEGAKRFLKRATVAGGLLLGGSKTYNILRGRNLE